MSRIVDGGGSAAPADSIDHKEQEVFREAEIVLLLCILNTRYDMMQYRAAQDRAEHAHAVV
jgi:hypothetical protein